MHAECVAWCIIQELFTKALAYIHEETVIISVGDVDWCVAAHPVFPPLAEYVVFSGSSSKIKGNPCLQD